MARKRMISPEIWRSSSFAELSDFAKIVFVGLISNADDEGRGEADAALLKSTLFPRDEKKRVADVKSALSEIARSTSTRFYSVEGKDYYVLTKWKVYQKLDRPTPSKFPAPPPTGERGSCMQNQGLDEGSTRARRGLDEGSSTEENRNMNKNMNERERARVCEVTNIPSIDDIAAYCRERHNTVSPQRFFDYYQGVGWTINGQSIYDWRAVVRRWESNGIDSPVQDDKYTSEELDTLITHLTDEE